MAVKCVHHSSLDSVVVRSGKNYCQRCHDGQKKAASRVDSYIQPRNCFIWYAGSNNWQPLTSTAPGTCCAHWVSHRKGIRTVSSRVQCIEGYAFRVKDLIKPGNRINDYKKVKVGDIYFTSDEGHCGIVVAVKPDKKLGVRITIKHCSSRQRGIPEQDFHGKPFWGKGFFQR